MSRKQMIGSFVMSGGYGRFLPALGCRALLHLQLINALAGPLPNLVGLTVINAISLEPSLESIPGASGNNLRSFKRRKNCIDNFTIISYDPIQICAIQMDHHTISDRYMVPIRNSVQLSMGAYWRFQSRNEDYSSRPRKSSDCAEAWLPTSQRHHAD